MRLIDADKIPFRDLSDGRRLCLVAFADDINRMSTIEPKSKIGKWIKLYANNYKCSECGDWWGIDDEKVEDFNFCPHCGSRNAVDKIGSKTVVIPNEIQIGDEVKDKVLKDKGIVTCVLVTRCDVLWFDGSVSEDVLMSDLCKTGRHFDEVGELLRKIKEKS